jgi:hypothetical protein
VTRTPAPARRLRPALAWWAVVVLTGAGLLAMHGLGTHGTAAGDAGMAHTSMASHTGAMHVVHDAAHVISATPTGHLGMDMGTMAMCLAVLAGMLLALRCLPRGRVVGAAYILGVPARAPTATARAAVPPDLLRLCVQRC